MTYAEKIAIDLARVVGAQPGSVVYHGIVGALLEVIEHCALLSEPREDDDWESATERIRDLKDKEE